MDIIPSMPFLVWLEALNTTLTVAYPMGLMRHGLRFLPFLYGRCGNELVSKVNEPLLGVKVDNVHKLSHEVSAPFSRQSIIQEGQQSYSTMWVGWSPPPAGRATFT